MKYGSTSRSGKQPSNKKMGQAGPVNPSMTSPGVSTDSMGRPAASFKGAGANVTGSRGPSGGNYIAGKGKAKSSKY